MKGHLRSIAGARIGERKNMKSVSDHHSDAGLRHGVLAVKHPIHTTRYPPTGNQHYILYISLHPIMAPRLDAELEYLPIGPSPGTHSISEICYRWLRSINARLTDDEITATKIMRDKITSREVLVW